MSWNQWVRQAHRWVSVAFTVGVIVNIFALGKEAPPPWVYLLALVPLALLQFSGLYLLVLPYALKRRSGRPPAAGAARPPV